MNKDVIYIDIEDDITAIIGKVKAASSKIVALVPPKRAGVLQSVVNLKLLQKAATTTDKRVVLITNDHSLTALAAGVKMPVAKNLQSRPEVPDIEEPQADEEEIINGADLPVGEMATAMGTPAVADSLADKMSSRVDLRDAPKAADVAAATADSPKKPAESLGKKMSSKMHIPDFSQFRNKFFLFGGIGAVVIVFLVWALVFAPYASVKISAQTIAVGVDRTLSLDPAATSDTAKLILKPNVQQLKKSVATTFTATGKKDIGNKATGQVTLSNAYDSQQITVQQGTILISSEGKKFTTNTQVVVPGASVSGGGIKAGTAKVAMTATESGDSYNVPAQSYTVQGYNLNASAEATTGGTTQMATIVSQEDVDKAKAQLASPDNTAAKNELKKQFVGDFIIVEESYTADSGQPAIDPAIGQPAQQAKITVETTYTYVGIARADAKAVITDVVNGALQGKTDQQAYSLGDNNISFQTFQKRDDGKYTTRLVNTAYIGPKIDTKALAKQLTGKRFGEIQSIVNQIQGVDKVEINLSPFWVNTAPSADKIDISFSVGNGQ